ncbi:MULTISPECIES: putative quinol monooxygenase [Sinomicrobium]|uniref:putative quinol monooxygenase n=1 Tax=Sinomicrobium TaxID=1434045 RepID=UPI000DCEE5AE|nr:MULTISPECIES: putative quinol monooxygenase [Sinomicrobium]RAV29000.1 antibiotic biosynthesis monooxygenase [Sinomicrobium sp. N-1-3-6]
MNNKTITTFAKWQVKQGNLEAVISLLKEAVAKSSAEEGNLKYEVYQGNDNENILMLFEEYTNQEALEFHRNSAHFQDVVVGKIIPLLENREVVISSLLDF